MKLKKYKKNLNYSYTYGVYPTLDLLKHKPDKVVKVYLHLDAKDNEGVQELEQLCKDKNIRYEYASSAIDKISAKENTYALGIFTKYETELSKTANHVVLVNPSNPGNLGTIIRTMNGFGYHDLAIIEPAVDSFDPMLIRSSMGSFFNLNIKHYQTFAEYQKEFEQHTLYPFVLNGKTNLTDAQFSDPYSLVFGNEGQGLGPEFENMDTSVYIKHSSDIDSLNLSVAVGVALFSAQNN